MLNVSKALISRIEHGHERPDWHLAFALRNAGCCLDWLYTGIGRMAAGAPAACSTGLFAVYSDSNTPPQLALIRRRLGLCAHAAGAAFCTTADVWAQCETGTREPDGALLVAMAERGLSINAIVTGEGALFQCAHGTFQCELALTPS